MKIGGERFLREDIKNIKVAVIGDIMLDRYISGNVERISPEAPVPINLVKSQRMFWEELLIRLPIYPL